MSVFVPAAINPTSGFFLLIPEKEITMLDMSVEEGFKLVISAGAVNQPYYPEGNPDREKPEKNTPLSKTL